MVQDVSKITIIGIESNIKELEIAKRCCLQQIALRKQYRLRLPNAVITATAQSLNATLFTNDVILANLIEINAQSVQIF